MEALIDLETSDLRAQLQAAEADIARLRSKQLSLVRELDRRQAVTADGCGSLSEWVAGRVDVAPETASALVVTARALESLLHTADAFAEGDLSWDRTVELARIATADDELDVLLSSYDTDIAGLRRLAARMRRVTAGDEQRVFTDRYLVIQPTLDDLAWRLSGRLPSVAGKIVEEALTTRADEFPSFPDGTRAPLAQRRADALVAVCQGDEVSPPVVTVHVDGTDDPAAATITAGPRVGPQTIEALLCHGSAELTALAADGTPLGIGRRSRVVPPRLRRFVLARDGGCLADGCTTTYRLQAHHRVPYSDGGRTDADNLVALCWFHHHVVIHGHGFTIDPDPRPGRIRFRPPQAPERDPP